VPLKTLSEHAKYTHAHTDAFFSLTMSSGSSGSRVAKPVPVFCSICDFKSLILAVLCVAILVRFEAKTIKN
jgi:hypothetical protein